MNLRKRAKYAYFFIATFFIVFIVFQIYPIIYSLQLSFQDMDALTGKTKWVGLRNYNRLLSSPFFYQSIGNTIVTWIISIIPQLSTAFLLSLMLQNKWLKGRSLLRNVYYFPNLVTPVTIGLLFGTMFSYPGGTINQVLQMMNLDPIYFSNDPFLAKVVIGIAICWKNFGFNIIYFTAGLNSVADEVYEAADVDGATAWQKTTRITIPMLRPMLIYVFVTSIIGGLQMFDESKLVFTSVPDQGATTMVKYMYDAAFVRFQFGFGAACAFGIFIVIAIFSVIALIVTREKNKEGLAK